MTDVLDAGVAADDHAYGGLAEVARPGVVERTGDPRVRRHAYGALDPSWVGKAGVKPRENRGAMEEETIDAAAEWDLLWSRVRLTFTDDDEEAYRKRVGLRDRMMAKNHLDRVPASEGLLRAAMVEYARTHRYKASLSKVGAESADMWVADTYCPEVMMVRNAVMRMIRAERDMDREDKIGLYEEALEAKATDTSGTNKSDARAAMFMLEGLDRRTFGKREEPKEDAAKKALAGGGVQLNIIGDAALKLIKKPDGERSGGVFIDV